MSKEVPMNIALRRSIGAGLGFSSVLSVLWAQTPCVNCAPGTIVNAQGIPDANGAYLWYPNYPNAQANTGSFWACSVVLADGTRRPIHLGDPTVLKIGDYYYLTGSSDVARAVNFPIYKSHDLVNWKPHMLAFAENYHPAQASSYDNILTGGSGGFGTVDPTTVGGFYDIGFPAIPPEMIIGGRYFVSMFAPQLYVDPADGCTVYLAFNARRRLATDTGYAASPRDYSKLPPDSVFVTSIPLNRFVQGGVSNSFGTPTTVGYRVSNNTGNPLSFDGGVAAAKNIPTSGPDVDASTTPWVCDWNTGTAGAPF
jgi:hypothetical protein